jgi:hypothetical protein
MAPICKVVSWLIVSKVQVHRTSDQVGRPAGHRTLPLHMLITMCGEFNHLCADAVCQLGILLIVSVGATCISHHDIYVSHSTSA